MNEVNYFYEEIDFKLSSEHKYNEWIYTIALLHQSSIKTINYIFCSDAYILKVNQEYLNHDYYTDIISFPYAEKPEPLEGDIFISIEMVNENAHLNDVSFDNELLRVMAHGILHFLGFKDKSEEDVNTMRAKEEEMIKNFPS